MCLNAGGGGGGGGGVTHQSRAQTPQGLLVMILL